MAISWQFLFDWAGDGGYATDEAGRVLAVRIERGRSDPFGVFEAGKATIWLENNDRRYDPYYTASPLYPNVLPWRGVRILAGGVAGTTGEVLANASDSLLIDDSGNNLIYGGDTAYYLFSGRIEDIEPSGPKGNRTVCVTVYDKLADLANTTVEADLQANVLTSAAVAKVLEVAGWLPGDTQIDTSTDLMSYWWIAPENKAKAELDKLAAGEYGAFFVTRNGDARFVNRANYTGTGVVAGYLDEGQIVDLKLTTPWQSVKNDVRVTCYPVTLAALAELWRLNDTPYLWGGESLTLWAEFTDANGKPCSAANVLAPVVTTDYTTNSAADGSGWIMSAWLSVTATIYDTRAQLVITNNYVWEPTYITFLRVRGQAIMQNAVTVRQEDAASQALYGRRQLVLDLPTQQSVAVADEIARLIIGYYDTPAPTVTLSLDNRLDDILTYELCDLISFTSPEYSLYANWRLDSIKIWTGLTMQDVKAELVLSQPPANYHRLLLEDGETLLLEDGGSALQEI